jgi:predicted transglutaminase-like cysteine proteinase
MQAMARIASEPEEIAAPPAGHPRLFGSAEAITDGLLILVPKAEVVRRSLADGPVLASADGEAGAILSAEERSALARWSCFLATVRHAEPMTRLVAINDFANAVPYVSDRRHYGVDDYWATPTRFFAAGGDCEDFALAKFVSLHRLGFHEDRLRIALVLDRERQAHHAVLAVYLADEIYVLDNQIQGVISHGRISHYRPICSFDSYRLWIHAG